MAYFDKYGVEFSDDKKTLVKCPQDFKGEYIIPNSVTSIGSSAFYGCSGLTSVTIGNSVIDIGENAFGCCPMVSSIIIGDKVANIGDYAFCDCENLIELFIPSSVKHIGENVFLGCSSLARIVVERNNQTYDSRNNCNAIIETNSNLLIVGCSQTIIPNGVTRIGSGAFYKRRSLTAIAIPDSVTSIGEWAFEGCSGLTSLTIPNSVTNIGEDAFINCTNLKTINLGTHVTKIEKRAFAGCNSLLNLVIPNNVKYIGEEAFWKCLSIRKLTIGNHVTEIGFSAFRECENLSELYWWGSLEEWCNSVINSCIIPERSSYMGYDLFINGIKQTDIVIPSNISNINDYAFKNSRIRTLRMHDNVENIGRYAFYNCMCLTDIHIGKNVKNIWDGAFKKCTRITSVTIPNSVKLIGESAFRNCASLTTITVGHISTTSFQGHIIEKYEDVVYWMKYIFEECSKLKILYWIGTIGEWCENMIARIMPNNYDLIIDGEKVTTFITPDDIKTIGSYTFDNCSSITSIVIGSSVEEIGEGAFHNCCNLYSITFPKSLKKMHDYYDAFSGCHKLNEIHVPLDQEERFCAMDGLRDFAEVIRKTSENQKAMLRQREAEEQRLIDIQQRQEMMQGSIFFFDTETTGTPRNYKAPISDSYNWPRLVQLAWVMADKEGNVLKKKLVIIKPSGFSIPADAAAVHGITTEKAERDGVILRDVLEEFEMDLSFAGQIVGHNIDFDQHIVGAELYRLGINADELMNKPSICTMKASTDFCAIPNPNPYFGGYKWPSLQELYRKLFGHDFSGVHDALADVTATKECYFELKKRGIIKE